MEESRSDRDWSPVVVDNRKASQFELLVDGQTAFLAYKRSPASLVLVHTEVPPSLRGRHLADALAQAALDAAHAEGLQIVAVCPFIKEYMRKHPQRENTTPGSDEG